MPISHVYQVPFMEAGHAINMLNVGSVLAAPEIQTHVLALSRKNTEQWLKATGQAPNPDLSITVVGEGKWEDWHYKQPADLVHMLFNPEFNNAMDEAISSIKKQHPDDHHSAVIINPLMAGMLEVAKKHQLKCLLLVPTAYYVARIDGAVKIDGTSKNTDEITYRGIGGSDKEMVGIVGDMVEFLGAMRQMGLAATDAAVGVIFSITNGGLEGDEYEQVHMPDRNAYRKQTQKNYFIGPIMPLSYEGALESPDVLQARRAAADQKNACIHFLNYQPEKSVVYITMGSVAQLSTSQAIQVIQLLRKYKISWIILFHKDKAELEFAIGDHPDGIIVSWAPQLDIMLHPAIKVVLGHGGFGTMIEGVFAGQPFICSPIFSDQFIDTRVMEHLGICVGNLAVNKFESIMQKKEIVPYWPDDEGKTLAKVFDRAFGEGGEAVLSRAREASLALRARMVHTKITKGAEALQKLREDLK